MEIREENTNSRRQFLNGITNAVLFAPFVKFELSTHEPTTRFMNKSIKNYTVKAPKSIIGSYGTWASALRKSIPEWSFRAEQSGDAHTWKKDVMPKVKTLLAAPPIPAVPEVSIDKTYQYDGLEIEELSWQLPYGRRTKAVLLRPIGVTKPLPGILALHDHAAKKYFGYRKIVKLADHQHPLIEDHQATDYDGKAWANEIAKKGYVVLVHDTFAFGSRRVCYEDVEGLDYGPLDTKKLSDDDPEKEEHIMQYNAWAAEHEHVMAKSLFSAGTTWPGVVLTEDQMALSVLGARKEVDPERLGCGGLSGGGLRTVYLGGLDPRIKCAVCVGFMTTWNDLILNKSFTHTWMTYAPLMPNYLEFPEILGLRVPLPTLVQSNNQDELYSLPEMKTADQILKSVFEKANAGDRYQGLFYDGAHKFDAQMQKDAFAWFDKWLK